MKRLGTGTKMLLGRGGVLLLIHGGKQVNIKSSVCFLSAVRNVVIVPVMVVEIFLMIDYFNYLLFSLASETY